MAATLALIKSRMLLPPDGVEDDQEAMDPRAELVARLLEYQRFKEVAESLEKHCIMMENVNYGRSELLALNLVRNGLLGEILASDRWNRTNPRPLHPKTRLPDLRH